MRPTNTNKRLQAAGLHVGGGWLEYGGVHWHHLRVITLAEVPAKREQRDERFTRGVRGAA